MTHDATFAELHAKRGDLDADVARLHSLADTIETRLRLATGTVRPPDPRDVRSRGRKGPSDPTGGMVVSSEDYAVRIRGRWHELIVGHRPNTHVDDAGRTFRHRCPDLEEQHANGDLDVESLAGMVARAGGDLDGLAGYGTPNDPATDNPTAREFDDTIELANRLQDCWHLLYQSRTPSAYLLGTLTEDLARVKRTMFALADDLRLWSDEVHPGARDRCACRGAGCNHTTRCRRQTDGIRDQCDPCRAAQYRRRKATV